MGGVGTLNSKGLEPEFGEYSSGIPFELRLQTPENKPKHIQKPDGIFF